MRKFHFLLFSLLLSLQLLAQQRNQLTVYDLLGQKIYQEITRPGNGIISWKAKGLSPWVYLYRIFDGEQLLSVKIQLVIDN